MSSSSERFLSLSCLLPLDGHSSTPPITSRSYLQTREHGGISDVVASFDPRAASFLRTLASTLYLPLPRKQKIRSAICPLGSLGRWSFARSSLSFILLC